MFGLNGKSMARQARHRCDYTKAISKLTYGACVIDSDWCWILIPFTASSLTLRHRLVVYLQTAKWVLVSFFFSLIFSFSVFLLPLFPAWRRECGQTDKHDTLASAAHICLITSCYPYCLFQQLTNQERGTPLCLSRQTTHSVKGIRK